MVGEPHHPRNEMLDNLFVSLDDLSPRGRATYETNVTTFKARDYTALRNWMLGSVSPKYARLAFRYGWPISAWYTKFEEVVDYRGLS